MRALPLLCFSALAGLLAGCGDNLAPARLDAGADLAPGADAGEPDGCQQPGAFVEDVSACQPLATDYQPRVNGSADDSWPACISDDDVYHPINESISTIARVAAFEQIAAQLWANDRLPSATDFIDARVVYAQDQGLDSRVQRRHEVH